MSGEIARDGQKHEAKQARYFVGDINSPPFEETGGYFVGFFMRGKTSPDGENLNILGRDDVECSVIELPVRDESRPHYHRIGYEITFCLSGELHLIINRVQEVKLKKNQFIVIPPGTVLQNPENNPGTKVFVVKVPSVPKDKYYAE